MSKVIAYKVTRAEKGGYNVESVNKEVVDASGWSTTEEGAILAFKDSVTAALPSENTFIFVTETQLPAMEDHTEMEKYGGVLMDLHVDPAIGAPGPSVCFGCLEDPCQCCEVCKGLCRGH